ncbi:MAG TPA: hypothetical protein VFR84_11540 [Candidatus Angelobacter sp.]|nr:hypothetical protein [Candidatus Angelobacter sp.]
MAGYRQFETGSLRRWIALSCVVLALLISGLEAMHAHSDAAVSRNSAPCAICLSVHVNASTVNVQALPQRHTVEAIAIPYRPEGKSAVSEHHLFIRPPPAA